MSGRYFVQNDERYCGWCIFFKDNECDIFVDFHAGAFESKAHADSEAKRLNDLYALNALKEK